MPSNQRLNGHRPTGLLHLLDPALKLANHPEEANYNFDLYAALGLVVKLESQVPETAFSAQTHGTERDGSAVLINHDGILVTIGYLVLDASTITTNIIRDGLDLDILLKTDNRYNYMDKCKEH